MPEGPEVTFMCHELNEEFRGTILEDIQIKGGRYTRHGIPKELVHFIDSILPAKIIKFHHKGKFLYCEFDKPYYLGIVLAMTGHVMFQPSTHTHYHFITNKGTFYIEDMRNFATIHLYHPKELMDKIQKIGPDLLHEKVTDKLFIDRIRKYPNKPIATVLLDQKVISGIGNYLRADGLYKAKISPFRLVKDVKDEELKKLKKEIYNIMVWATKSHIQHKYMRSYQFLVYGRKSTDRGEDVVATKLEPGRSIYWVPKVQT